jgi:tetratricopeptide (TPR) repeat protein
MGVIQADIAEYAEAEASHQRVLALRRAMSDRWGEATSLANLGVVARHQGAYARAEEYYRAAIAIRREMRDDLALALALSNLGDVLHFQGGYAEAMGLYLESLHLRRERDDRYGVAMVLTNIGVLRLYAGELDAAEHDFVESLRLTREVGDRHSESNAELDLALLAIARDQRGAALHHVEQALVLAEAVGNPAQVALVRANMTEALLLSGQHARAWQAGRASLTYFRAAGHVAGCIDALEALALCAAAAGDCAAATCWSHAAAARRDVIGVPLNPVMRASLVRWLSGCAPATHEPLAFEAALREALAPR